MTNPTAYYSILLACCLCLLDTFCVQAAEPKSLHWKFQPEQVKNAKQLQSLQDAVPLPWQDTFKIDSTPPYGWVLDGKTILELPAELNSKLLPPGAFTLATWVRVDAFPEWSGIFSALEDNGSEEYGIMLGLKGRSLTIAVAGVDSSDSDGTMTYTTSMQMTSPGKWSFVVATYDQQTVRLYVDGTEVGRSTAPTGAINYPQPTRVALGGYLDANERYPLNGRLGELWVHHTALTDDEVFSLYRDTMKDYPAEPIVAEDLLAGWDIQRLQSAAVGEIAAARVPTAQYIEPAGVTYTYSGRPVDAAIDPAGKTVAFKDNKAVTFFEAGTWQPQQRLPFPAGGASMHGMLFSPDGQRLWVTTAQKTLYEAGWTGARWDWLRAIDLPGPDGGNSHGCGIAFDGETNRLYICLSRNNSVAEVDLAIGKITRQIPVSVAPFDVVLIPGTRRLVVSNWGGRHPRQGEDSALSSGTAVLVDERGIAKSGTVGLIDLDKGQQIREVTTGLHPADLLYDPLEKTVLVANANSDTVSVISIPDLRVRHTIIVRPAPELPFGSASNALAMSPDATRLFVANGGNNAVAVLEREVKPATGWRIAGFMPTAWYPGGLVCDDAALYVANVKGMGSRIPASPNKYGVHSYLGAVSRIPFPSPQFLSELTDRVKVNSRVPQILRQLERQQQESSAEPVPQKLGGVSPIKHVVYIIKENRTYDQVLGDLPQGDGEPKLCDYPRAITPNHHALAEQFVLLDNFFCNGVNSADGHSWATEGNVTDHLEKSFGGFTRSYTFGDDPLTYSSTGFIWDNVLLHGLTFRNYGEMDYAEPIPGSASFKQIYDDFVAGTGKIKFRQKIGIETLARYSCPDYPGWNMKIPDVLRAAAFIKELEAAERAGQWYNFVIVYLPQDHTSGLSRGMPRPEAHMADNDLALGQVVGAISQSRFWPETAIFVVEDDPQAGYDHIDGHRSICLVVSPFTKRGAVVSEFYNQTSVLHTMQRILGLPPMNQLDAGSPLMSACFTDQPDLTAYQAITPDIPLDRLVAGPESYPPGMGKWFTATANEDFAGFDRADEQTLNQILWHAARGPNIRYPQEWAGAHGRGLKGRGLIHSGSDDDDDD